MKESTSIPY